MQKYCLVITCGELSSDHQESECNGQQTKKFFGAFGNFYVFHYLRLFQHQGSPFLANYTCFICYDMLITAGWDVERLDFSLRSLDQSNLIDVITLLSSEPKSCNNSLSLSNIITNEYIGYIVSSARSSNVYPGLDPQAQPLSNFSDFSTCLHITVLLCISLKFSVFLCISLNFSKFLYIFLYFSAFYILYCRTIWRSVPSFYGRHFS